MPYDPNWPQNGQLVDADRFRAQFGGLKDLIDAGVPGPEGPPGADGAPGPEGPPGPDGLPFSSAVVDGVSTLAPGTPATVDATFDGTTVHLTFGIPSGTTGADGEVTNAALDAAIAGTSANTNGVETLDTPFTDDPPTLADMELLRGKINEMILAQRR